MARRIRLAYHIVLSASLRMKYEQRKCEKCGHRTGPDQTRPGQAEPGSLCLCLRLARCSFAELVTAACIVLVHRVHTPSVSCCCCSTSTANCMRWPVGAAAAAAAALAAWKSFKMLHPKCQLAHLFIFVAATAI